MCGCPVGTVRSRVARAREDLVAVWLVAAVWSIGYCYTQGYVGGPGQPATRERGHIEARRLSIDRLARSGPYRPRARRALPSGTEASEHSCRLRRALRRGSRWARRARPRSAARSRAGRGRLRLGRKGRDRDHHDVLHLPVQRGDRLAEPHQTSSTTAPSVSYMLTGTRWGSYSVRPVGGVSGSGHSPPPSSTTPWRTPGSPSPTSPGTSAQRWRPWSTG